MFIVGSGTSEGDRKNAFQVLDSGRATVGADPVDPMDVVTKQYLDARIREILASDDFKDYLSEILNTTLADKEW